MRTVYSGIFTEADMIFHQISREDRIRRGYTNEAIALAMESRWEEAVIVNRAIIDMFPNDADAYNRLGKALAQMGRYSEARAAYNRAVEIEPNNSIARKNLERLAHLAHQDTEREIVPLMAPQLFIEETGKSTVADLRYLAPGMVLAKMSAGDPVVFKSQGQSLIVENAAGEYLGEVEPRIGLRLMRLMEGGNRYAGAVAGITPDSARVMIKEVFQHPSQAGRPSFPARPTDDFRPYVKGSMLKYEEEEEEISEEDTGETDKVEPLPEEVRSLEEMAAEEEDLDKGAEM